MHPFDRVEQRVADLMEQVEAGEPIDYEKQAKLSALDLVEAGLHYTREAIDRTTQEDEQSVQRSDPA